MSELREAFVRARFAEPAMFGTHNIERYTKDSKEPLAKFSSPRYFLDSAAPAMDYYYMNHLAATWGIKHERSEVKIGILAENASEVETPLTTFLGDNPDVRAGLNGLLEMMRRGGAKLYDPQSHDLSDFGHGCRNLVVVNNNNVYSVRYEYSGHSIDLRQASAYDIHEVLEGEFTQHRARAQQAIQLLDREFVHAVQLAREAAERDFDEACAVSADGTKIVKAEWVVVVDGMKTFLYSAAAFRDDCKATLRNEPGGRLSLPTMENSEAGVRAYLTRNRNIVAEFRTRLMDYLVFDCGGSDNSFKVLFIRDVFCPRPLREDGIEIRI